MHTKLQLKLWKMALVLGLLLGKSKKSCLLVTESWNFIYLVGY